MHEYSERHVAARVVRRGAGMRRIRTPGRLHDVQRELELQLLQASLDATAVPLARLSQAREVVAHRSGRAGYRAKSPALAHVLPDWQARHQLVATPRHRGQ